MKTDQWDIVNKFENLQESTTRPSKSSPDVSDVYAYRLPIAKDVQSTMEPLAKRASELATHLGQRMSVEATKLFRQLKSKYVAIMY